MDPIEPAAVYDLIMTAVQVSLTVAALVVGYRATRAAMRAL